MSKRISIPVVNMVMSVSSVLDMVNQNLVDHHKRVSYIGFRIAEQLGLSNDKINDIMIAGSMHDIGAISVVERLDLSNYDEISPMTHAEQGGRLLKTFSLFDSIGMIVQFHHVPWANGEGRLSSNMDVPNESHILHLADRVEVLINRNEEVLLQAESIRNIIKNDSGRLYKPEYVEAFLSVSESESFWLDVNCKDLSRLLYENFFPVNYETDLAGLVEFAKFFSRLIDLRSRFTATHSSGVATTAQILAEKVGMDIEDVQLITAAGYFHDLGKLSIPLEILEKESALNPFERTIIKKHTFFTYRILETLPGLEKVNRWASYHHEKLSGVGYPFRIDENDIDPGSRIMTVADVFTALTEDRPYRTGMSRDNVFEIIDKMVDERSLDPEIVNILKLNYEEIDEARKEIQSQAVEDYNYFHGLRGDGTMYRSSTE